MYRFKLKPWKWTYQVDSYKKFTWFKFKQRQINNKPREWIIDFAFWRFYITNEEDQTFTRRQIRRLKYA